MKQYLTFAIMWSLLGPIGVVKGREPEPAPLDEVGFRTIAVPFLQTFCLRCHGPADEQGEFRVDQHLSGDFQDLAIKGKWGEVVNVLNSHEMPPEGEPQPQPESVAHVVDWITAQMVRAELTRRDSLIVLRRMNRDEYRHTIRDLVGVDYSTAHFPQDPPTGGFDNNGGALTVSPLHVELYFQSAREILDKAFVEGEAPPKIRWRFEPDSGKSDSNRVEYDGQRLIVNGGNNRVEQGFVVLHHANWDRNINVRDFRLKHAGEYIVRIRAGGNVPTREQVVESARKYLQQRLDRELQENPERAKWKRQEFDQALTHFRTDRMYDYGSPRIKVTQNLGGQPTVIAEMDVDAPAAEPKVYEIRARFTTQSAGITLDYAYDIPKELENFWMQTGDDFARPEAWIDWLEIEGPVHDTWPPISQQRILFTSDTPPTDEREHAREVIRRFMRRAYRRPVGDDEVDAKLALFDTARAEHATFQEAIKTPLIAVLVSPHFLYLSEPQGDAEGSAVEKSPDHARTNRPPVSFHELTDQRGRKVTARVLSVQEDRVMIQRQDGQQFTIPLSLLIPADQRKVRALVATASPPSDERRPTPGRPLNDHELATRLAYFLWSTMPDEELFRLADEQQLRESRIRTAQIDRMLADPKSEAFVKNFAGQWLGLREVGANPPAADLYRRYDRHLETSMVAESLAFFREILDHDLSVMNFVKSDFVVINERLGRFYGIPGVKGDHFRRVAVPPGVHRGGILTQASVLSITSNGTRTSPVKRGTWVMKNVLGLDPGLPVANAGEIAPKVPGIDKATVRQRLEIHRTLPQCARCHNKIDPLGFALENFDASGDWREREGHGYKGRIGENDPLIDASSKLLDGTEIDGIDGLRDALSEKQDLFLSCLAGKMFTYALGRELGVADQVHVAAAVKHLREHDDSLRALIKFVVNSEPFLTK